MMEQIFNIIDEIQSGLITPIIDVLKDERDKFLGDLKDYLETIKKDRQK